MPYTDFHYTPTGTGVISGKEVLEQTEDAINDLGTQISGDVQTAIDTANNALNTANTASTDAQNAVNTANTAYTTATNAQNTANTAQNTASNALTAAQNAQNDVNALGNRVTTAENNITQNTTDISGLTSRMGTAEGNITTLQNDVITAQSTATSAQNTATLARGQAYVVRYASVAVSDNSTVPYTDLNNTDNIKANDLLLDINGKLYQISSVDTANETVSVTIPLTQLALDADVLHRSGNETAAGIKTFSDDTFIKSLNFTNEVASPSSSSTAILPIIVTVTYTDQSQSQSARLNLRITADGVKSFYPHENLAYSLGLSSRMWSDFYTYHGYFRGQQQSDEYSVNARTNLTLLANRDTLGQSGCVVDTFRENTSQGTGMHILGFGIKENSVRYEGARFQWAYDSVNSGYDFNLAPTRQGTNNPLTYNLGTSTNKWDTINGLEPSLLGFPDLNNGLDISGYITNFGAGIVNEYTPVSDGWISIANSGDSPIFIRVYNDYGFEQVAYSERNELGGTTGGTYTRFGSLMIPCLKNIKIYIIVSPSTSVLVSAKFYPCLGNV